MVRCSVTACVWKLCPKDRKERTQHEAKGIATNGARTLRTGLLALLLLVTKPNKETKEQENQHSTEDHLMVATSRGRETECIMLLMVFATSPGCGKTVFSRDNIKQGRLAVVVFIVVFALFLWGSMFQFRSHKSTVSWGQRCLGSCFFLLP